MLTNFHGDEAKKFKKGHFPAPPILNIFFSKISWIGPWVIIGLIEAKSIDVAQPLWLSGCPT